MRCRINRIAVAVVAFSQGVPFFHAGDEILRSKSLDRDSYNGGDWFNRLEFLADGLAFQRVEVAAAAGVRGWVSSRHGVRDAAAASASRNRSSSRATFTRFLARRTAGRALSTVTRAASTS